MPGTADQDQLLQAIVERLNVGIVAVNEQMCVLLWNEFMESHSGISAGEIIGRNLFEVFPDLPRKWLEKKIKSVFLLRNFAFTSWEHRPYLFRFHHNRPVTGGVDYMQQSCTFQPVANDAGEVAAVSIAVFDVTDASVYHRQLQMTLEKLKELSIKDGLTGVYNRGHMEVRLDQELTRFQRYRGALSVIMLDVDNFKKINDSFGHLVGDEVLVQVTGRLTENIRSTDLIGRYGGEEFVIVLPNTRMAGALSFAERLRAAIATTDIMAGGAQVPVTVSIGIAEARIGTEDSGALLRQADLALYVSKKSGRNRVTCYSSELASAS